MVGVVRDVVEEPRNSAPQPIDVVVTTDATAEGELVASALRARGFQVIDAPLGAIEARALVDVPSVVIFDGDEEGVADAVMRVAAMPSVDATLLVFTSDPASLGQAAEVARVFERPVDIDAVLAEVVLSASPPSRAPGPLSVAPGSGSMRPSAPPELRDSDVPRIPAPGAFGAMDGLLESDDAAPRARLHLAPSPELARLLAAAEERAAREPSGPPLPPGEADLFGSVAPEFLALLDEPLDPEGDAGTGAGESNARTPSSGAGTSLERRSRSGTTGEGPLATNPGISRVDEVSREGSDAEPAPPPDPSSQLAAEEVSAAVYTARAPSLARFDDGSLGRAVSVPAPAAPRWSAPPAAASPTSSLAPTPRADGTAGSTRAAEVAPSRPTPRFGAEVWGEGGAVLALGQAIAARASGALALLSEERQRRIVLRDGDVVTAASEVETESLTAFLVERGDIARDTALRLRGKVPLSGRHAGAALVAHGHLAQDDLWPVLRAHAEWTIARALSEPRGTTRFEDEPPARLRAEPSVFGGATGAEVLVEILRRAVPPELALTRLGGEHARFAEGPRAALLSECALAEDVCDLVRAAAGWSVGEVLSASDPELAPVLHALVALGVLEVLASLSGAEPKSARVADPLDEEAFRERVRARLALVEEGDYFALLGVARGATSYEIRRAYVELRRAYEPGRVLTARTADLHDGLRLLLEVLDEAYDILRDAHRRERYRRAIEGPPPPA